MDADNHNTVLTRIRHRLARWIAPDLTWNPDISLENDRLRVEIERLKSHPDSNNGIVS